MDERKDAYVDIAWKAISSSLYQSYFRVTLISLGNSYDYLWRNGGSEWLGSFEYQRIFLFRSESIVTVAVLLFLLFLCCCWGICCGDTGWLERINFYEKNLAKQKG